MLCVVFYTEIDQINYHDQSISQNLGWEGHNNLKFASLTSIQKAVINKTGLTLVSIKTSTRDSN